MSASEFKRKQNQILGECILLITFFSLLFFIGVNGVGYLVCALCSFVFSISLLFGTMTEIDGRLLRSRLQKGQGKNALSVYKASIVVVILLGSLWGIAMIAASDSISNLFLKVPYAGILIRILSPGILLLGLVFTLCGYFRGIAAIKPESTAKLIGKAGFLVLAPLIAISFKKYGNKVSTLLFNEEFNNSFGALGVCIAILICTLISVLFLFVMKLADSKGNRFQNKEGARFREHLFEIIVTLIRQMLVGNITQVIFNGLPILGFVLVGFYAKEEMFLPNELGIFFGAFVCPILLCMNISKAVSLPLESKCISGLKREEYRYAREKISWYVHCNLVFGGFLAVCFLLIGSTFTVGCFPELIGKTDAYFRMGSILIFLIPITEFFQDILVSTGRKGIVNIILLSSFVVSFLVMLLGMKYAFSGFLSVILGLLIFYIVLLIAFAVLCVRLYRWRFNYVHDVVVPLVSAVMVGVLCMLLNRGMQNLTSPLISFFICFILGAIGNIVVLLALKNLNEEELQEVGLGRLLIRVASFFHFFER